MSDTWTDMRIYRSQTVMTWNTQLWGNMLEQNVRMLSENIWKQSENTWQHLQRQLVPTGLSWSWNLLHVVVSLQLSQECGEASHLIADHWQSDKCEGRVYFFAPQLTGAEVWYQSIGFTWKWLFEPFQITVSGKWLVVGYVWKMAFLVRWEIASTSQLFSENHLMRLFRLQICFLFSHTGRLQNVFLDSGCLRELRLNWL